VRDGHLMVSGSVRLVDRLEQIRVVRKRNESENPVKSAATEEEHSPLRQAPSRFPVP
jgi:hypothetical protein